MHNTYNTPASIITRINSSDIPDGGSLSNGLLDLPLVETTGVAKSNAEKDWTRAQDITPTNGQSGKNLIPQRSVAARNIQNENGFTRNNSDHHPTGDKSVLSQEKMLLTK